MLPCDDDVMRTEWHPRSWMHDVRSSIGHSAVTQVFFVGSHNAGTHGIEKASPFGRDAPGPLYGRAKIGSLARFLFRGVSAAWAKCQGMSIRAQLDHGVRYLDLRVAANPRDGNRLYTTHGQISVALRDVVKDVGAFLDDPASANEFVVLDFQHLFLAEDGDGPANFLAELGPLSSRFIPAEVPLTTPLSLLWEASREQRVFLLVSASETDLKFPAARVRSSCVVSRWVNQSSLKRLLRSLTTLLHIDLLRADAGVPPKLYVTQAIYTPRKRSILRGFFAKAFKKPASSLHDVAARLNSPLLEWFCSLNAPAHLHGDAVAVPPGLNTHGNILMLDYVEVGHCRPPGGTRVLNAVGMCVYLNLLRASRLRADSPAGQPCRAISRAAVTRPPKKA
ncbi:variant-surface-glycoprotein phospholipase C [Trypanosoma conorhini]|uniref:Variant-surface-glycoprotein phospholipase C n=1 Tax=Trypanosoma conorhini TaxID=83891 RepID=A0A422NC81_9TRYP|nr:variant-surface-glycoprotein phospholipase C [Trypanosoma conorhini]RNF02919.1 variant-surface-glycoprotein phospholipase C [Trypanosoma conorhini]